MSFQGSPVYTPGGFLRILIVDRGPHQRLRADTGALEAPRRREGGDLTDRDAIGCHRCVVGREVRNTSCASERHTRARLLDWTERRNVRKNTECLSEGGGDAASVGTAQLTPVWLKHIKLRAL